MSRINKLHINRGDLEHTAQLELFENCYLPSIFFIQYTRMIGESTERERSGPLFVFVAKEVYRWKEAYDMTPINYGGYHP